MNSMLVVGALSVGSFMIPIMIVAIVLGLVFVGMAVASRYIKVPPNAIAVFYGRKYKYQPAEGPAEIRGFHILTGGGRIVLPIVEKYQIMSTAAFQIQVSENGIPTAKNVRVNVSGVVTCKISDKPEFMSNAVQSFLGKDAEEIAAFVQQILNGHLRSIVGKLEIDQLLRKRDEFNAQVVKESTAELARLGLDLVSIVIKDINDTEGFIDALGKQAVAEVKRDAEIRVAEANRDTKIKVSEAERLASEATAQNQAKIAQANAELAVKQAELKQQTEQKRAVAEKAYAIADAEQAKTLATVTAARDSVEAEAQAGVQEKRAMLKQKELEATLLVEAEAQRKAAVITADAEKQALVIRAEAAQQVAERTAKQAVLQAEGEKLASVLRADGTKAAAIAEGEGEASRTQAVALAAAKGEEAKLLATAKGVEAKLAAEAAGQRLMAEALKQLNEQGKLIVILDRLPGILEKTGDAGAKMLGEVFRPVGAALGGIDKVTILDNGPGANGVGKFAGNLPQIIASVIQQCAARGIDISQIVTKLGIDASGLMSMLGGTGGPGDTPSATPATEG